MKRSAAEIEQLLTWEAPTEEAFNKLRKYKWVGALGGLGVCFPSHETYAINEFVWMAHATPAPTKGKKGRHSSGQSRPSSSKRAELEAHPHRAQLLETLKQSDEDNDKWDDGFWIGQIIEIRAEGTANVWLKVRWMCRTLDELKDQGVKAGLPKRHPGGREIFQLGPEFDDLQPVGAIEGRARVIFLDERNPMQAPIHPDAIFFRSEAKKLVKPEPEIMVGVWAVDRTLIRAGPGPGGKGQTGKEDSQGGRADGRAGATCYCGAPYRPVAEHSEPMAMCGHIGCLKWFHLGCLDWKDDHRRPADLASIEAIRASGVPLLSLLPEFAETTAAREIPRSEDIGAYEVIRGPAGHEAELRRVKAGFKVDSSEIESEVDVRSQADGGGSTPGEVIALGEEVPESIEADEDEDKAVRPKPSARVTKDPFEAIDAHIPLSVRRAAQAPIERGSKATGVTGNARQILRARQIMTLNRQARAGKPDKAALLHVEGMVSEWEAIWYTQPDDMQPERLNIWLCPGCRRPM
ncbi:hypothetical protein IAU60_005868 [Kwoniella sp. DSM 27419]